MEEKIYKVLWWADFKKSYSKHLIKQINKYCPDYEFTILDEIWELKNEDYDLTQYDIIVLQSTDVTKFSAVEAEREAIGERLDDFVDDGKKLIVSHDIIYRRTRNRHLQEMYNYQINNFYREGKTKYSKTAFCKQVGAFSSLQSTFMLRDGEICWGDISQMKDKKVFFDTLITDAGTGKKQVIPLVFGKIYNGDGQLIWFNTGDTFDDPPQPITDLDENFVLLLSECLKINLKELKDIESDGNRMLPYLHKCDFSKPFTFICYSAANSARVYELCLFLDKLGVNYFLDVKNITSSQPGSEGWKDAVHSALNHENCSSAFVFVSEDFLASENCYFEVRQMNAFEKPFVPILLSISLDIDRILQIINSWSPLIHEEKIQTFRDVMAIRKKPDSTMLEVNQLIFHCRRDLSHFKNTQLLSTIEVNCNPSVKLGNAKDVEELIEQCKEISGL